MGATLSGSALPGDCGARAHPTIKGGREINGEAAPNLDAVADRDADYQLHVTHRSSPDEWNTAPIGLFSPPKLELATIAGPVDAVVVSTDGAELSAEVFPTLDDWLSSHLQNRTPRPPHRYPHGDLAVVAVDLTGDNTPQA